MRYWILVALLNGLFTLVIHYPMNWRSSQNGECETFMLAEMVCGNVTEIYARIGTRPRWFP